MGDNISNCCGSCGEPATERCGRCKTAYYCSKACQKSHWPEHKPVCFKDDVEKSIYRACSLFQKAWYVFREEAFDEIIGHTSRHGQEFHIYDSLSRCGINSFTPFPHHMVKDAEEKAMMLTSGACGEPEGYLGDFLKELLGGLQVEIQECQVQLKLQARRSIVFASNGWRNDHPDKVHEIIVIRTAYRAEEYVLDAAGAQFGIFAPCIPLNQYWNKYIRNAIGASPFGTSKALRKAMKEQQGNVRATSLFVGDAAEVFYKAVARWKSAASMSLSELLSQPDNEFSTHEAALLEHIRTDVASFISTVDHGPEIAKTQLWELTHPGVSKAQHKALLDKFSTFLTVMQKPCNAK